MLTIVVMSYNYGVCMESVGAGVRSLSGMDLFGRRLRPVAYGGLPIFRSRQLFR